MHIYVNSTSTQPTVTMILTPDEARMLRSALPNCSIEVSPVVRQVSEKMDNCIKQLKVMEEVMGE